jgi:hypothetical protein
MKEKPELVLLYISDRLLLTVNRARSGCVLYSSAVHGVDSMVLKRAVLIGI